MEFNNGDIVRIVEPKKRRTIARVPVGLPGKELSRIIPDIGKWVEEVEVKDGDDPDERPTVTLHPLQQRRFVFNGRTDAMKVYPDTVPLDDPEWWVCWLGESLWPKYVIAQDEPQEGDR